MARKSKSKSRNYGAVARHGSEYLGRTHHVLRVCVRVDRNLGASNARQYVAQANPCTGSYGRGRYGTGVGRTPTAAAKKALRAYASKVK